MTKSNMCETSIENPLLPFKGAVPLHRDFHTACVLDDGAMYVFGGRSDEHGQFHSNQDVYCDRLYRLDLKPKEADKNNGNGGGSVHEWTVVKTSGDAPVGRRSHSVWAYDGCMYVFGG